MSEFTANLKYDLQTPEKVEEALKAVSTEISSSPNFSLDFSQEEKYLLVAISAKSSALLQEGLNAVYPFVEKYV